MASGNITLKKVWICVFATFPTIVLLEAQAVAPVGHSSLLFLETPFLLGLLVAFLAAIILPFVALRRDVRTIALRYWAAAATFVLACVTAIITGEKIRHWSFERLATRSASLVSAIKAYETKHGRPPESLETLVPDFFEKIPRTGMMAYPNYKYYNGKEAQRFDGNPWVLVVLTPGGGINFDQFMYFPLQNYPARGYGGSLQRIGDWAYVHE